MAVAYVDADVPALARLATLIDRAARGDAGAKALAEVRQLEDRFGLSPLARRRLQWEIDQATAAEQPKRRTTRREDRWLRAAE